VIPQPIALPRHVEVEAVQVHRVRLRAQVDDAPVDWLAEVVGEPLGVGPGEAIDREEYRWLQSQECRTRIRLRHDVCEFGAGESRPLRDDEHTILFARVIERVHDERP
jgi:hypothetical protein